jgi:hypothetical protein
MKTIWKYKLELAKLQVVDMPRGAKILSLQVQDDSLACIWALVNDAAPKEAVGFLSVPTGEPVTDYVLDNYTFLGTYQIARGDLVFHVFYKQPSNMYMDVY